MTDEQTVSGVSDFRTFAMFDIGEVASIQDCSVAVMGLRTPSPCAMRTWPWVESL